MEVPACTGAASRGSILPSAEGQSKTRRWPVLMTFPKVKMQTGEPLGPGQILTVFCNHRPSRLRPSTTGALERCPLGHQIPKSVVVAGRRFDDVLGKVVRDVLADSHRRPGDVGALSPDGIPSTSAPTLVVELDELHPHRAKATAVAFRIPRPRGHPYPGRV